MPEIKIRKLIYEDRKTLSSMILKLVEKVGDEGLLDIIKSNRKSKNNALSKDRDDNVVMVGVKILKALLQTLEDEVVKWFASLINVEVEEFGKQPFDIEIIIIKQLKEAEEIHDFFSGASQQFSEIQQWYNMLKKEKKL